jgi:pSer/pThr/pTyr-binding forkhead associated (FHA) protein
LSTWLTAWRRRDEPAATDSVLELLVVAGADAGSRFTLEGDEILIGRGEPDSGRIGAIRLTDRSISRRHAFIRRAPDGTIVEPVAGAANPLRVNGHETPRARLAVGDRLELGRVVIEVRARPGLNLTGIADRSPRLAIDASEATELRPMQTQVAELVVLRGPEGLVGTRHPVLLGATRIGRGDDVQIRIPERGVSRVHAELSVEGRGLVLVPRSATNPTLVNGFAVLDRAVLAEGDEIQLADQVVLGVRMTAAGGPLSREAAPAPASGLIHGMARKLELEREIEAFQVMGSFLDVDVVGSRGMKAAGERPEHIIVSFERFRAWVGGICVEFGGQVLNSNGDELMCFFERPPQAVLAGSAILARLAAFNRDQNLLGRPFRFRLGVHTGESLVDLAAGVAYSEVLDLAGHIQKCAEPDSLVISEATLVALPRRIAVTEIDDPRGDAGRLFRVEGRLEAADLAGPEPTQIVGSGPAGSGAGRAGD